MKWSARHRWDGAGRRNPCSLHLSTGAPLLDSTLAALQSIRVVDFETVGGKRKRVVTNGSERARKVLRALKIKKKPPPGVESEAGETARGPDVVTIRK